MSSNNNQNAGQTRYAPFREVRDFMANGGRCSQTQQTQAQSTNNNAGASQKRESSSMPVEVYCVSRPDVD